MENEITGESSSDESSSDGSSTDNSTADSSSEDESSLADSTTSSADSSSPESIDNDEGDDTVTKDDKSSIKSANNNEENSDCGDKKGRSIIKKKAPQRKIQKKKLLQDLDDLEEQFREESAIVQTEFENAESNVKQNISSKGASSGDENSKKDNNEKTLKTNLTIGDKTQEQIGENSPSSGLHASSSNDDNFDDAQEQQ